MTIQRPVIAGFHPDPSICRVGDTYYLATSSFEYAPGVPIFASTDLRSWRQIGHALHHRSQLDVSMAEPSGGVFAPTLRHHDGRFWMITTNWSDNGGQLLVWAEDPAGPWSDPVRIPQAIGIDPDLAWDDDGTCYLTFAGFGSNGSDGIVQSRIDPESGEILTERQWIWSGSGGKFPEGPHLYRIEDYWYLLIAEGGTERGHAVSVARGPSPSGPFEGFAGNPILTHRGTDRNVQNTGHADLVQRPDGSWAMVYHGIRARGSSPEWHVLGRETFAQDVDWVDGWPQLTGQLEPPVATDELVTHDLATETLPPCWVGSFLFPAEFVTRADDGWLVRAADRLPVFLAVRQEHLYADVRAHLSVRGVGSLAVRIDPRHSFELEIDDGRVRAIHSVGDIRVTLAETSFSGTDVALGIRMEPAPGSLFSSSAGPDRVTAGVYEDESFVALASIDGRYLSTEVAAGMTGRMIGIACTSGEVLVRSFRYTGADDPAVFAGGMHEPSDADSYGGWTTSLTDEPFSGADR